MTRFIYPVDASVYKISQRFGDNPDYYKKIGYAAHEGIDFSCLPGTPVVSVANGTVVSCLDNTLGMTIRIRVDGGTVQYRHLSRFDVKAGDTVTQGQQVGLSGNSGKYVVGKGHLHFDWTPDVGGRKDILGCADPMPLFTETVDPVDISTYEGKCIEAPNGDAYVVRGGKRYHSPDALTFYSNGFTYEDLIKVPQSVINAVPLATEAQGMIHYKGSQHEALFNSMRKNRAQFKQWF